MNAIAELQTGDLEAVIDLDTVAPMEEDGPLRLDPNEARNGRELAEILEDRLMTLLAVGEWGLCTEQRPRENGDLGGRMFVEPEETGLRSFAKCRNECGTDETLADRMITQQPEGREFLLPHR
jgi:hypothetical protein